MWHFNVAPPFRIAVFVFAELPDSGVTRIVPVTAPREQGAIFLFRGI